MAKTHTCISLDPRIHEWITGNIKGSFSGFIEDVASHLKNLEDLNMSIRYAELNLLIDTKTEMINLLQKERMSLIEERDRLELKNPGSRVVTKLDLEVAHAKELIKSAGMDGMIRRQAVTMQIPVESFIKNKANQLGVSPEQFKKLVEEVEIR